MDRSTVTFHVVAEVEARCPSHVCVCVCVCVRVCARAYVRVCLHAYGFTSKSELDFPHDSEEEEDGFVDELTRSGGACLSRRKLMSITGTNDLSLVTHLEVRIDAQQQSLNNFGTWLPCLKHLKLNGSTITSLRDLGSGLSNLEVSVLASPVKILCHMLSGKIDRHVGNTGSRGMYTLHLLSYLTPPLVFYTAVHNYLYTQTVVHGEGRGMGCLDHLCTPSPRPPCTRC